MLEGPLSSFEIKKNATRIVVENCLTGRQKQCLLMYYYENMKLTDIARKLGISVSSVSRHIKKAKFIISQKSEYYIDI